MPRKKKSNVPSETPTASEPKIPKELLDQLITGPITQSEFESIYRALKKAIIERAMSAEMTEHLGYKHGEPKPLGQPNQRNGSSGKTASGQRCRVEGSWVWQVRAAEMTFTGSGSCRCVVSSGSKSMQSGYDEPPAQDACASLGNH
jgi:Transposase, Mutator family